MSMIGAAERRDLYRFSSDLAKLALRIADVHGSSGEKWYFPLTHHVYHLLINI